MTTIVSPLSAPVPSSVHIDQGIDVTQTDPFRAIAPGLITHIDPNFYKGTPAVYEKLDQPITVNGRTYSEVYYSETPALIAEGKRVAAGTPVTAGGSAELGFAAGSGPSTLPAAHGQYTEGQQTQAGQDFRDLLSGSQNPNGGGGGGVLSTIEKAAGTPLDIITGGASGAFGVPSFIPSPSSLVGDAAGALGLTGWVKQITSWITKEASIGFLYFFLTLAAFGLLALALRRTAGAAPGATGYVRGKRALELAAAA